MNIATYDRYEEDIPLPELTPNYRAHLMTKFVVERGVCSNCGKTVAGRGGRGLELF